jgi:hypothetical protein
MTEGLSRVKEKLGGGRKEDWELGSNGKQAGYTCYKKT